MKRLGFLLSLVAFLTTLTCNDEPLEGDFVTDDGPTSCSDAILLTADAAADLALATTETYTSLCTAYRDALEQQRDFCGDDNGAIELVIDSLGDCSVANADACELATNETTLAADAFSGASDDNYTELCNAYQVALQAQIDACGDADGSLQLIIDDLGDCINENAACNNAIEASQEAEVNFNNANEANYTDLCNAYKTALQEQIDACGDADGSLQLMIDDLGDCSVPQAYAIGDIGPGGGFVFYVSDNGFHGLEVAPLSTQFQSQWGCPINSVDGTVSDFGAGQNNTNLILAYHDAISYYDNPSQCTDIVIATGDVAAKNCADLVFGGFNDWYLPSFDELQLVYDNLHSQGLGDFENGFLSSSTQAPSDIRRFRVLVLDDGSNFNLDKNDLTRHRAIRQF